MKPSAPPTHSSERGCGPVRASRSGGRTQTEWAIANLAILAAGCTVVPLSTRATAPEAADICARASVSLVIAEKELNGRGYLAEAAQFASGTGVWPLRPAEWGPSTSASPRTRMPSGDHVSHVQFTSGTTGPAKGAMLRHRAMVTTTRTWVSQTGLGPEDTYTIVSPCSHIAGHKTGLLACLVAGATAVPVATYSAPDLADLVDTKGVTFLQAAPTVFHDLVAIARSRGTGFPTVRTAVTGAATIPPALIRDLREVAGIPVVMAAYGLTEATGVVTMTTADDPIDVISTSVGRPIPGVEVRIVDPSGAEVDAGEAGEIVLRGESVMARYLDDPEGTAEAIRDGWLHTGDIGTTDTDGRLRIVDRLKDLILVGGFNVHPAEVEHVLVEHPTIREAAVVGVRDDRLGEVPVAYVVPDGPIDAEDVLAFCRARLSSYKVPRRIVECHDLPRNSAGKVLKRSLPR